MSRVVVIALCLACVTLTALMPAPAEAATRRVCAKTATLRDTPRGFVLARLYRGERVVVVRRAASRRWMQVRPRQGGLPGWILTGSLCRRG